MPVFQATSFITPCALPSSTWSTWEQLERFGAGRAPAGEKTFRQSPAFVSSAPIGQGPRTEPRKASVQKGLFGPQVPSSQRAVSLAHVLGVLASPREAFEDTGRRIDG